MNDKSKKMAKSLARSVAKNATFVGKTPKKRVGQTYWLDGAFRVRLESLDADGCGDVTYVGPKVPNNRRKGYTTFVDSLNTRLRDVEGYVDPFEGDKK